MSLGKADLVLSMDMCASHANLALDDLFNYDSRYSYLVVQRWLNDDGRCLLVDRKFACIHEPAQPSRGVLRGTINTRYPITFVFGSGRGNNGYFYDRYGQLIPLYGGADASGGYRFTEQLTDGSTAVITVKRGPDGGYTDNWTQTQTGKTMPVELR